MGLSHSGAAPVEPLCSSSESDSDSEGSSTSEEDVEGDLSSQLVLDAGLEVGAPCSSRQGAGSKRLSGQPPSATGCSSPSELGELSQELLEPSPPMLEPLDQHRAGQSNGGTSLKHSRDDGLSVQEVRNSSGEVGSSDGSDTDEAGGVRRGSDQDEEGDASCEASPSEDLQNLSLQNKTYQPHRDKRRAHIDSTAQTLAAATSCGGEQARIRQLVKRTVAKKRKQQQRHLRPNKVATNSTAVRRSKKSSRRAVTQDDFW